MMWKQLNKIRNEYVFVYFQAGSLYSGSELQGSNLPSTPRNSNNNHTSRKSDSSDLFWKGFAIFIIVTLILAIIISLIVYFIFKSHWLLIEE